MSRAARQARGTQSPAPRIAIRHLLAVFWELEHMRAEEACVIDRYLGRLARFAAASMTNSAAFPPSSGPWPVLASLGKWPWRLWRALVNLAKVLALAPSLLRQARRLRRIERAGNPSALVIGIASNRLPLNSSMNR